MNKALKKATKLLRSGALNIRKNAVSNGRNSAAVQKRTKTNVVRGSGDYVWDHEGGIAQHIPGTSMDSILGKLGRSLGGALGGEHWSATGGQAGNWISKILGFGDYEVKSNSIVSGLNGDPVPAMHSSNDSVIVRHREYVTDVFSATTFANDGYPINPGNQKLFPWLAPIAANFRMWRLRGCLFEYKSTCATSIASANPAMGSVMMTTNYNVYDPLFTNKTMVDNNTYTTSGRPMDTFVHPLECAPMLSPYQWMYVRTNGVPSGQDQRLYDMGLFQLARIGTQSVANVGELWITYEIELAKPILYGGLGIDTPLYMSRTLIVTSGVVLNTYPSFEGTDTTDGQTKVMLNDLGIYLQSPSVMVLPKGNIGIFELTFSLSASAGNTSRSTACNGASNCTVVNLYTSSAGFYKTNILDSTSPSGHVFETFTFYATDPNLDTTINLSQVALPTNAQNYQVCIVKQLPMNIMNIATNKQIVSLKPALMKYRSPTNVDSYASMCCDTLANPIGRSYAEVCRGMKQNVIPEEPEEEKCPDDGCMMEMQEIITCPRPQTSAIASGLRALGLSKSTLDIPALKRQ